MSHDPDLEEELATTRLSRRVIARIWQFMRPYRHAILAVMVIELLYVGAVIAGPHIIRRVIDRSIPARDAREALLLAGALLGCYAARWLLDFLEVRINVRSGQRILGDIRKAVFRHVQFLSMRYFDKTKAGRIISRADRDVDSMEHTLIHGPIILVNGAFLLVFSGASMLYLCWKLAIMVAAVLPALVIASEVFRRRGIVAYRKVRESLTVLTSNLAETISGVRVIQAFSRERHNSLHFSGLARRHADNVVKVAVIWNVYSPFVRLLNVAAASAILLYGGWLVLHGETEVGVLAAFVLYLGMFFGPIFEFSALFNEVLHATSSAERIFQLLDEEPEVRDLPGAPDLPRLRGQVRFEDVSFRYDQKDGPWILKDIDFTVEPGEMVAFVGSTGAGKSSIISLLARFYEPVTGRILIDGRDIAKHSLQSLHAQMGVVLQENFLFTGTVMENLRYGRPEVSDEEVIAMARSIGAHQAIQRLSDGYQTSVGERGARLSQGERQLICFARALIADPRILVLDEATSSVDTATEEILQRALFLLVENRTSFVVAHRLCTVRHADRIFVVDSGRIVETGQHQDLLAKDGRYAAMFREYVRA
jgi:ABC-type multidrug transport system fused ATPase/permease subunit